MSSKPRGPKSGADRSHAKAFLNSWAEMKQNLDVMGSRINELVKEIENTRRLREQMEKRMPVDPSKNGSHPPQSNRPDDPSAGD